MLRLALRGAGHPILVTDAMPPVGGSRLSFTLNGETIAVRDGQCRRSDGTLAGAYLDMATAVGNCVRLLEYPSPTHFATPQRIRRNFSGSATRLAGSLQDIAPIW